MRSLPFLLLTSLLVCTGCGADGPQAAETPEPPREDAAPAAPRAGGAVLKTTGRPAFQGGSRPRCVLHEAHGLQVNFRTGSPAVPAVVLRIEQFHGAGDYRGRLFVTGRGETGALAGASGSAEIELRQEAVFADTSAVVLSGSFEGTYSGEAGRGSLEGRFEDCPFSPGRGDPPRLAAGSPAK